MSKVYRIHDVYINISFRLQRNFNTPFSFAILPSSEDGKIYRFCCETDTERLVSILKPHTPVLVHDTLIQIHLHSIDIF